MYIFELMLLLKLEKRPVYAFSVKTAASACSEHHPSHIHVTTFMKKSDFVCRGSHSQQVQQERHSFWFKYLWVWKHTVWSNRGWTWAMERLFSYTWRSFGSGLEGSEVCHWVPLCNFFLILFLSFGDIGRQIRQKGQKWQLRGHNVRCPISDRFS